MSTVLVCRARLAALSGDGRSRRGRGRGYAPCGRHCADGHRRRGGVLGQGARAGSFRVSGWVWSGMAILALVIGAVLSTLVQSLRDLSRTTLEEIAAIRNRPAATERINRILEDVEGHTAAVALPRVVCNLVLVVALVGWVGWQRQGQNDAVAPSMTWVEVAIGVGSASLLLWLIGVIVPTSVAKHAGDGTVYAW